MKLSNYYWIKICGQTTFSDQSRIGRLQIIIFWILFLTSTASLTWFLGQKINEMAFVSKKQEQLREFQVKYSDEINAPYQSGSTGVFNADFIEIYKDMYIYSEYMDPYYLRGNLDNAERELKFRQTRSTKTLLLGFGLVLLINSLVVGIIRLILWVKEPKQ